MRDTQSPPSNSANTSVSLPSGSVIGDRQLDLVDLGRFAGMDAVPGRVDVVGPQPEHHFAPGLDIGLELAAAAAASAPLANTSRPPSTVASLRFIGGEPMKPATKRVAGRLNTSSGVPTCSIWPSRMMTMRSDSVIASTWSCVT